MVSFVFDLPEKVRKPQGEGTPFQVDLSKAEAVIGFIDYERDNWLGEIKLHSKDEESNKQIVTVLNGLKGMGALAGPEVAELVGNINLTATDEHIKLDFSVSNELLEKLKQKAAEKSKGMSTPPPMPE